MRIASRLFGFVTEALVFGLNIVLSLLLIETIGYTIGRLLLPLLSGGRVYAEPLGIFEKRRKTQKEFGLLGYRCDDKGKVEMQAFAVGLFGLSFLVPALIAIGYFVHSLSSTAVSP